MADTILSVENLSSLKVADLKRELKDRGLTTSGNKTDLIERLTAHLEAEGDVVATEDLSIGDASLSLNETGGEGAAKLDISAADDSLLNEEKETVLKTETQKPARQKITMSDEPKTENGHVASEKKVLSAEERLKMRGERFGVQSEEARKKARAERFGVTGSTAATTKAPGKIVNTPVTADDLDKLKKRAERFGTVVSTSLSKATDIEKLKQRSQRFGAVVAPSLSKATDIEKLKQRSQRFGAVVAPSLSKVEEQERIRKRKERFGALAGGATTGAALSAGDVEAKKRKRAERFGMS